MCFLSLFGKSKPKYVKEDFFNIKLGDEISYNNREYIVSQILQYTQDIYKWFDFRLTFDSEEAWLTVDDDDVLKLSLFKKINYTVNKIPQIITCCQEAYTLEEKGKANVVCFSEQGEPEHMELEYGDYENIKIRKFLSVEKWNDGFELSIGYPVDENDIIINSPKYKW